MFLNTDVQLYSTKQRAQAWKHSNMTKNRSSWANDQSNGLLGETFELFSQLFFLVLLKGSAVIYISLSISLYIYIQQNCIVCIQQAIFEDGLKSDYPSCFNQCQVNIRKKIFNFSIGGGSYKNHVDLTIPKVKGISFSPFFKRQKMLEESDFDFQTATAGDFKNVFLSAHPSTQASANKIH